MSDRSTIRGPRRFRLAAGILVAAMTLPSFAVADHLSCTPGAPGPDGCDQFEPKPAPGSLTAFTDTPSSVNLRFNQKDHHQPVIGVTNLLPKGWQFAVNSLRPGQVSEGPATGSPATSCKDVIVNEDNDADDTAATLGRAEALAGTVGFTAWYDWMRDTVGTPMRFGYTTQGPNEGNRTQNPSLSFVNYNPGTGQALFCMYAYANDDDVAEEVDPITEEPPEGDDDRHCNFGTACFGLENEDAREHIIPITLTKVQPGEMLGGEDISLMFGWRVDYDLTSFYGQRMFNREDGMIIDVNLYMEGVTAGNWNLNPVTGLREKIVFSRTPKQPGDYEFRNVYTTCAKGFVEPPDPGTADPAEFAEQLDPEDLCVGGELFTAKRSIVQKIQPPPTSIVYDFGKLTGPKGALSAIAALQNFGIVRGTNKVKFDWNQPPVAPTETIKGYLLTVAVPGQESTQHFEYMITDPAEGAGVDPRQPCGADGKAPSCSVELSFPLSTIGSSELPTNGKYNVSLVTIYQGQGGDLDFRSDGKCDNGNGFGVSCPPAQKAFRIVGSGMSTWQLLLRSEAWPMAFVQNQTETRTGGGGSFLAPGFVLLVDFAKKKGEFIQWNAVDHPAEVFAATSNGIIGDNDRGGLVSFFSPAMVGHAVQFRYDGAIFPAGNSSSIGGGGGVRPFAQAQGVFVKYDPKGLPAAFPPGGMPTAVTRIFQANAKV